MLKIRDGVDLKELEKFGFEIYEDKFCSYATYNMKSEEGTYIDVYISGNDKILRIENDNYQDGNIFELDGLYDLIKADLIEKVDE